MFEKEPVPSIDAIYWFYGRDRIKLDSEFEAKIVEIYSANEAIYQRIPQYNSDLHEMDYVPLLDVWLDSLDEMFWILSDDTDYIIKIEVPELCKVPIYCARTKDGGWHSFETNNPNQFGILDTTGENHRKLHSI